MCNYKHFPKPIIKSLIWEKKSVIHEEAKYVIPLQAVVTNFSSLSTQKDVHHLLTRAKDL